MAISFVGGATASSAGNTDVSVSLTALTGGSDSAPSAGDLVIFAYNIADADNADLNMACNTTGFDTNEVADLFGNGTQDANLGVYWKFMTATPDTAVVGEGSLGGTDTAIQGVAMVFRGVATVAQGGPFDVTSTTATGTTGGLPDPPSINTSGAAGIWTVIVGSNAHAAGAGGVFTAPTNYTTDFLTIGNVDDTADGIIGMGYRTDPGDPEDPGAFADNVAATGWCAVTMALKPAPEAVSQGITGNAGTSGLGSLAAVVVLALSGVAGTGATGNLGKSATTAIVGNAGTGAVGTVVPSTGFSAAISGNAGTGSVGTLTVSVSRGLAGNAGTGSAGSVTVSAQLAISGTFGTGAVGSLSPSVTAALAGNAATGAVGTLTPVVGGSATVLSGNAATGSVGTLGVVVNRWIAGAPSYGPAGAVGGFRRGRWGPY